MTTDTTGLVGDADVRAITDWLNREAELLDAGLYRQWLDEFISSDLQYRVPIRVTRERDAGTDVIAAMSHMDDDWDSMEMRVLRIETGYAWAEDPPSQARHFITNVRVSLGEVDNEFRVATNMLLYRTRSDLGTYDLLSGERRDLWRRTSAAFELVERVVLLDQTNLMTHNLALIM